MQTTENYKVLSVKELSNYLLIHKRQIPDFDSCLKTNDCLVYNLKSDEVILLPKNLNPDSKGLLFLNKKYFLECEKNDYFPIENENATIEDKYNNDITNLAITVTGIIEQAKFKSYEDIPTALSDFLMKAKANKKKLSKKELFDAALILGEYVRIKNNGRWLLIKKYGTFNPYYSPAIIYTDNSVLLFWDFLSTFFISSAITPEIYSQLPYIKNPELRLESPFFQQNYFGHKIL